MHHLELIGARPLFKPCGDSWVGIPAAGARWPEPQLLQLAGPECDRSVVEGAEIHVVRVIPTAPERSIIARSTAIGALHHDRDDRCGYHQVGARKRKSSGEQVDRVPCFDGSAGGWVAAAEFGLLGKWLMIVDTELDLGAVGRWRVDVVLHFIGWNRVGLPHHGSARLPGWNLERWWRDVDALPGGHVRCAQIGGGLVGGWLCL